MRDPLSVWEAGSALALLVLVVVLLFLFVLETRNPDIVWSCDFGIRFFAGDLDALQAAPFFPLLALVKTFGVARLRHLRITVI